LPQYVYRKQGNPSPIAFKVFIVLIPHSPSPQKSIAMSMLSWGVGLESRTKLKGSKGKSKIRSRSKTKEKGKAKEKGSTLEEDNEEKGQRGSCSSSHFSGDDDFLALEPPWYTHAYSSFKPLEESGRSSPSPPTSPRYIVVFRFQGLSVWKNTESTITS